MATSVETAMNALVTDLWFAENEGCGEVENIEEPTASLTIITVKGQRFRVTLEVIE